MKNRISSPWLVYSAAVAAMLFWGGSYVWSTIVFDYWGPITTIFLRTTLTAVLLFSILKIIGKSIKIERKDYPKLFILALFNPFLYFLGESFGLKYSSPTISAAFIALIPIFTTLAASIKLKERLPKINLLGMTVSFIGIILMILDKNMEFTAEWYGIACLILAVLASVGYSMLIRGMSVKYNPFTIIAWQDMFGAMLFLPLFLIFEWNTFVSAEITKELIASFLMLLIFSSMLAFPFHTFAIREIGVSRASIFANLIPVVTAITSFIILREYFDTNKIAGIILVISGVFLSQIGKAKLNENPK
ncbi:DMT family transporter [Bacteroidales bacterium OttesenSCG-928-J16]|nr:DMT family transporter [Bacteroidales bacterium OttesenSCG-928-J16]